MARTRTPSRHSRSALDRTHPMTFRPTGTAADVTRCTYIGTYSQHRCLMNAAQGSDRCHLNGHSR